ncbi:hypothetical protein JW935_11825 [candidate division KSB1 bacterium]|nr:hypothetical protein [candidate division KSB1 bacterium]
MSCEKILKQICDELAEDINSETCEVIRKHLDECENCRTQLTSMRNMVALFRCLEDKNVPKNTHERLLKLLNMEEPKE